MSEEIKEILDNMKEWSVDGVLWFEINDEKAKLLYDYITNLQERFNALLEAHKIADELETEYQNRIDKAIEYIKEKYEMILKDSIKDFLDHDDLIDRKRMLKLIDILKGDEND